MDASSEQTASLRWDPVIPNYTHQADGRSTGLGSSPHLNFATGFSDGFGTGLALENGPLLAHLEQFNAEFPPLSGTQNVGGEFSFQDLIGGGSFSDSHIQSDVNSLVDDGSSVIFSDGSVEGSNVMSSPEESLETSPTDTRYSSFSDLFVPCPPLTNSSSLSASAFSLLSSPHCSIVPNSAPIAVPLDIVAPTATRPSLANFRPRVSSAGTNVGRLPRRTSGSNSLISRAVRMDRARSAQRSSMQGRQAQDESSYYNLWDHSVTEVDGGWLNGPFSGEDPNVHMDMDYVFGPLNFSVPPAGPADVQMDPFANAENSNNGNRLPMEWIDLTVSPPTPKPVEKASAEPTSKWPTLDLSDVNHSLLAVPTAQRRRGKSDPSPGYLVNSASMAPGLSTPKLATGVPQAIPMSRSLEPTFPTSSLSRSLSYQNSASHMATSLPTTQKSVARRPRTSSQSDTPPSLAVPTAPMPIIPRPGAKRQVGARSSRVSSSPDGTQRVTLGPTVRGRRQGQLTEVARVGARTARVNRTVCIRCKHAKQTCRIPEDSPDGVCEACLGLKGKKNPWQGICTKASFEEIVKSGTLNYISQLAVNHVALNKDKFSRIRIDLNRTINLDDMLVRLHRASRSFDIRVKQGGKTAYVLDLAECYTYLSSIREQLSGGEHDMRSFIDRDILKCQDWMRCVRECDPTDDPLSLLIVWNNMPSRATYSYVPKAGNPDPEHVMDPEILDRDNVILAAQLSRIVCRKLEVEAYTQLQKILNASFTFDREILPFLQKLGRLLLTLRWRVSWWVTLGGGSPGPDDTEKKNFEERVNSLSKVLYFYYCSLKRRLPSFSDTSPLKGVYSQYADAGKIWDDFPVEETIDGFKSWMERGQKLIEKAEVVSHLKKIKQA